MRIEFLSRNILISCFHATFGCGISTTPCKSCKMSHEISCYLTRKNATLTFRNPDPLSEIKIETIRGVNLTSCFSQGLRESATRGTGLGRETSGVSPIPDQYPVSNRTVHESAQHRPQHTIQPSPQKTPFCRTSLEINCAPISGAPKA
mgnify:CR=1 FL=1